MKCQKLPWRKFANAFQLSAAILVLCLFCGKRAQAIIAEPPPSQPVATGDAQHDFDFNLGAWRSHIRRIQNPLSGGNDSIEINGTVRVRKIWGGRAQLEEIEADGPKGHWQGMTLFLYNPQSHQWSQSFLNSKMGILSSPLIGAFKDGRGELFSQDTSDGKSILIRGVWSDITADAHHYEESYSTDGGRSWSPAFVAELTRDTSPISDNTANTPDAIRQGQGERDFDFDFGIWKTHSSRLLHPLTGSTTWVDFDGETIVKKLWGGRANLAEYKAVGSTGQIELLSLRWYNPTAHQWNLGFATPNVGSLGIPSVGEFKNGRGDFYDYEEINGRFVMVRFSIWGITSDTAQSEQAFSADGGRTWEVNWINRYTRVKDK